MAKPLEPKFHTESTDVAPQPWEAHHWMATLNDVIKRESKGKFGGPTGVTPYLSWLNIPGTHETAARAEAGLGLKSGLKRWFKCSDYSITEQLEMGYRWFDFRVRPADELEDISELLRSARLDRSGDLLFWHGSDGKMGNAMGGKLIDAFDEIATFLKDSNECVLLKIKHEDKTKIKDKIEAYWTGLAQLIKSAQTAHSFMFFPPEKLAEGDITLDDCGGGKVLIWAEGRDPAYPRKKESRPDLYAWEIHAKMHNLGKGGDAAHLKKGKKVEYAKSVERYKAWKDAVAASQAARFSDKAPNQFWRNGINANSLSAGDIDDKLKTTTGTPLDWALIMNREVAHLLSKMYTERGECVHSGSFFSGVLAVDLPQKPKKLPDPLHGVDIAKMVAQSNYCRAMNFGKGGGKVLKVKVTAKMGAFNLYSDDYDAYDEYSMFVDGYNPYSQDSSGAHVHVHPAAVQHHQMSYPVQVELQPLLIGAASEQAAPSELDLPVMVLGVGILSLLLCLIGVLLFVVCALGVYVFCKKDAERKSFERVDDDLHSAV